MVDGSPTASIAPVNLLLQVKSPEDMNINYFFVSLERLLRMLAVMISAFLPGVWVAFSAYNIEQIPYPLVATISTSRFGLPLSAPLEMFIVLFLFEFFNEAGIRLPRAIGQTVSVTGRIDCGGCGHQGRTYLANHARGWCHHLYLIFHRGESIVKERSDHPPFHRGVNEYVVRGSRNPALLYPDRPLPCIQIFFWIFVSWVSGTDQRNRSTQIIPPTPDPIL